MTMEDAMFRKILFASDLTEGSKPALRVALSMGRRLGIPVVALHVTEPPFDGRAWFTPMAAREADTLRALAAREQEAAKVLLEKEAAEAETEPREGPPVSAIVRAGIPADIIPATAADVGADLIVMGTHGRKGISHLLMGSVAERVVRSARCVVMTVRSTP
ncbi:MAG: universal stress protein [Deltaproteobacteria bacterium]|nr:universal stress protein [Deltaproteobacteria bacterium]